jgi:hypothetical protein
VIRHRRMRHEALAQHRGAIAAVVVVVVRVRAVLAHLAHIHAQLVPVDGAHALEEGGEEDEAEARGAGSDELVVDVAVLGAERPVQLRARHFVSCGGGGGGGGGGGAHGAEGRDGDDDPTEEAEDEGERRGGEHGAAPAHRGRRGLSYSVGVCVCGYGMSGMALAWALA